MKNNRTIVLAILMAMTYIVQAQQLNRPIGQYPGNPSEYYGPTLEHTNGQGHRNLALYRTVFQSSSWDYNLTSQLLTDGIYDMVTPAWLNVTTPEGPLPPHKREACIDGNEWTSNILMGGDTWIQYDWEGMEVDIDEVELVCNVAYRENEAEGYTIRLLTSNDGKHWKLGTSWSNTNLPGTASSHRAHSDPNKNSGDDLLPTRNIDYRLSNRHGPFKHMRLEMVMPAAAHWTITELKMRKKGKQAKGILPSEKFVSAWRSLGNHDEWVTVDLGSNAKIYEIALNWINNPSKGNIQVSDDNKSWKEIATLSRKLNKDKKETFNFNNDVEGRYVRINMVEPNANGKPFSMREIQIEGTGGTLTANHQPGGWQDDKWLLNGGDWQLTRASNPMAEPLTATVPATVLSSYVNAGALPDMNHDDNLMLASESFFNGDFIYKRSFDLPSEMAGKRIMLNFDGINWKADVTLNGTELGRIEGAFIRGKFDITPYLKEKKNELQVLIHANDNPGGVKVKTEKNTDFNGGILGADNPTFHATIGWDWISTIRGRDIGIWDDVYLTASGDVTVSDPVVTTKLGETDTLATMTPAVMLTNHSGNAVTGTLHGHIGEICFEKQVTLAGGEHIETSFNPEEFPQLKSQAMRLWWPNGYGEPYLYDAGFEFIINSEQSDAVNYKAGIREVKTVDKDTKLRIYVNHRRLIPRGGNWAFSENNLNYRGREFDAAVRHHREMNYNMIRNWVGMTGDKEFFEACDRYGIMVWQDFWLANPADGPDPDDEAMFMDNARDFVLKIRNHPCIGIYCGRNEGYPPKTLDDELRALVEERHIGLDYISSSADDGVSGHGPYWALSPKEYFERQTGKLHTERGMPNVMTYEGLSRTLDADHLWPQNLFWGRHDYTMEGAQRGASFNQLIADNFGEATSAEEFCDWAQWINYEGYRAMYESGSKDRMGLLIWMSHPCWPSMVWQTYDYYLEPTAAYYGVKHACEPLHVQWNPLTNHVEVVNYSAGHQQGTVKASIIDLNGKAVWEQIQGYVSDEDMTLEMMQIDVPQEIAGAYFLSLTLIDDKGNVRSRNDYVNTTIENDRTSLHDLRQAQVAAVVSGTGITLTNQGNVPAVMLRLNLKGDDGEQILPVIYSDNYFHLMPGESRTIDIEWKVEDARGCQPMVEITGTNVPMIRLEIRDMKIRYCLTAIAIVLLALNIQAGPKFPYQDATKPVEERVEDLLSRMTIEEKVGQLICLMGWDSYQMNGKKVAVSDKFSTEVDSLNVGMYWAVFRADPWTRKTIANGLNPALAAEAANAMQRYAIEHTRLGIPIFLAEEAPHGHMAIGTTVFPTGLGMAATWDTQLMQQVGADIGKEIRLQGGHISYGPVLDLAREPRWSRVEETMGEDPYLSGEMGAAMVKGLGGGDLSLPYSTIATLKHFIAYGVSEGGQNGARSIVGPRELKQVFLQPFKRVIDAGALSVMTSYNSLDGVPCTSNRQLLNDVLRDEWRFRGFVVSDLFSIDGLKGTHHIAIDSQNAAIKALLAGVDVDLGGNCYSRLIDAVKKDRKSEQALNQAVRRVLRLKFEIGLFEHPFVDAKTAGKEVHSEAAVARARQVARESITLLKNDGILPMSKETKVAVIGPNADNIYNMLGDYTAPQTDGKVVTVYDGIKAMLGEASCIYAKGCAVRDTNDCDIPAAIAAARQADVVIAVVGGSSARDFKTSYEDTGAASSEQQFVSDMECGEGFDRATLDLLGRQMELLEALKNTGKPLVVVYIEGRPLNKNWADENANALLTAYYPGEQGGNAIADVLFGDYNPAGRLPVSVPRHVGQLPVYYNKPAPAAHDYVDMSAQPLYPFGYGLSYTTFEYSELRITQDQVAFMITNTGSRKGDEVVQLYVSNTGASVVQPERQLIKFERVSLEAGESRMVTFDIVPAIDLAIVNNKMQWTVEGNFEFLIGSSSQDIRLKGTVSFLD